LYAARNVARILCNVAADRGCPVGVVPAANSANIAVKCLLVNSASFKSPMAGIRYAST
jgi:hypothetical protein